jgi:excisionase family DNA binding protein
MWLSPQQAANMLHVSTETLRRMAADGRLEGVRTQTTPGGHARYNRDDLLALIQGNQAVADGRPLVLQMAPNQQAGSRRALLIDVAILVAAMICVWLAVSTSQTQRSWERDVHTIQQAQVKERDARIALVSAVSRAALAYGPASRDCRHYIGTPDAVSELLDQGISFGEDAKTHRINVTTNPELLPTINAYLQAARYGEPDHGAWRSFLESPAGYLAPAARSAHFEGKRAYQAEIDNIQDTITQQAKDASDYSGSCSE